MSERLHKVNDLVRDHLGEIIRTELALKAGVFVTLTKVATSKDLRHASVYLSVFPEGEENYVEKTLTREQRKIERALHAKLYMKPLPKIRFVIDDTAGRADEVEKLLIHPDF
jgi:ribosome-binding factor A